MNTAWHIAWLALALACGRPAPVRDEGKPVVVAPPAVHDAAPRGAVTVSIIGTNDLHGALTRLPILAGYIANMRAARSADGGVLLVDGGDLFQGTLESNIAEGVDVVRAYNLMGYAASAVGNHEFDYGPIGPAVTVQSSADDPRGALKARIREASFPFLAANIMDDATGARVAWPNLPASTIVKVAGVSVGIVGVSTSSTPYTTMPANFIGLRIAPPAPAIVAEAKSLREQGATVVVVVAHIGSKCRDVTHAEDSSSCDHSEEIFQMLAGLPPHTVDVIVAGHTHAAIAHVIDGIAIIESYSSGRAFGRIDLRVEPDGKISAMHVFPPTEVCRGEPATDAGCTPNDYEGKPVVADAGVQQIVADALARAGARRGEKLGVTLAAPITRAYGTESAEGDLFGDLMLVARPDAQVSLTNGGGLRADLPKGELTYGQLFEAMPFDNRFAIVELTGAQLRALVTSNLQRAAGIFSWGGLTAVARCAGSTLDVNVVVAGKPLADTASYKLVTSDFLASGGDGVFGKLALPATAIHLTDVILRDAMADVLRKQGGTIDPATRFGPTHRRLDYPGNRPVKCGKTKDQEPE